jgi:hypothetical protein
MKRAALPILLCLALLGAGCVKKRTSAVTPPASSAIKLIDLKEATMIGEKTIDLIPEIPGSETTLRGYLADGRRVITFTLQNGKTYAFAVMKKGESERFYADRDNDGRFEESGQVFFIDLSKYGY